jgi:hypothetical protein
MGLTRSICFTLSWSAILGVAGQLSAAEPNAAGIEFFEKKVRPLFAENCYPCHGEEKQKNHLRLDSPAAIRTGGDGGAIITPEHPENSRIILAVGYRDEDLKMPPKKQLSAGQVADLTEWVKLGAPMPAEESAGTIASKKEFQITDRDRAHWAFQPLKKPATPSVKQTRWAANPLDYFILARLEADGFAPNPPATKSELIRRAYYDLTGLPPSPSEVEAFLGDSKPGAWERLVDRLLESPRYGEKWGRHWLDLVRFAESNSYERDGDKPNAWRYRDYVIRAFNDDKPYDRFIREQLAGDEFAKPEADAIIATGFYRLGIWDDEPADRDLARYDGLDDIVATTGQVFLGLTVDCARCHNHKLDPIPQKDYYRMLSFFQNIQHYRNGGPTDEVTINGAAGTNQALAVTENGSIAPDTFVLVRGNPQVKGEKVEPAFLEVLGAPPPQIPLPALDAKTSGRRTALANWITSPTNQLTARVMANRIWEHHFGRGLVRSPNNFGLQGDRPTHPELLDWLACEFIAQGWRTKPIHRLIMTSSAYQMSSQARDEALRRDPANDHFWRFNQRRLTAEEIRDTILADSGALNVKMYGPGIFVDIPKEVTAGQSRPGNGWGQSPPEEQARRSVYIKVKRSLLTPLLESFDLAETDRSTPVRFNTVQPTQALGMMNGDFLNHQAEVLAARLRREAGDNLRDQVRLGLYLVTSRPPTNPEIKRSLALIAELLKEDHVAREVALKYFCLMALNLNEMIYLD